MFENRKDEDEEEGGTQPLVLEQIIIKETNGNQSDCCLCFQRASRDLTRRRLRRLSLPVFGGLCWLLAATVTRIHREKMADSSCQLAVMVAHLDGRPLLDDMVQFKRVSIY